MKLRNKKTGEIVIFAGAEIHDGRVFFRLEDERGIFKREINSLTKLNEEWEDYEEPKNYWFINSCGVVEVRAEEEQPAVADMHKQFGNYFETREEAEKAVEKLKAVKRLKDNYFVSFDLDFVKNTISFNYRIDGTLHSAVDEERIVFEDLKTIFGGEE